MYLISRTLCQGRAAGLISLAGTTSGFVVHIVAASLGLSAVLIAVPVLFDVLRFAGAAYLLWLAWDALRSRDAALFAPRALARERPAKLFRTGLLTSILQSLLLGATQIVIAVIGDSLFVLGAARVSRWLGARPAWEAAQRYVQGGVFTAIAVKLALAKMGSEP